ncbi:hypothetical protein [Nonomuraea sp. NPDC046570]|uniref:hypothetical protein n=1 Tax=Nonomuraea sp. NPDC046570 TaxID=3155255 RepID=UPI0034094430
MRYPTAALFAEALMYDLPEGRALPGNVTLFYFPRCPDSRSGMLMRFAGPVTDDLRNLTHKIRHHLADMRHLGQVIADHLPELEGLSQRALCELMSMMSYCDRVDL